MDTGLQRPSSRDGGAQEAPQIRLGRRLQQIFRKVGRQQGQGWKSKSKMKRMVQVQ